MKVILYRWSDDKPPSTILCDALNIAFVRQLLQMLVDGGHIDAYLITEYFAKIPTFKFPYTLLFTYPFAPN